MTRIKVAPAKSFSLHRSRFYRLSILSTHKDAGCGNFKMVFFPEALACVCVLCAFTTALYIERKGPPGDFICTGENSNKKAGAFEMPWGVMPLG
jgi:hypothetical protein